MGKRSMAGRLAKADDVTLSPEAMADARSKAARNAERLLVRTVRSEICKVAAAHAAEVDEQARFPEESFAALKKAGLLGIMVPAELGGMEASIGTIAEICSLLAQNCSSTGMCYAMHQIKASSLVMHATHDEWHRGFMRRMVTEQLLLGSATTEGGGVGGDLRTSHCGVETEGELFSLRKEGCLISYGAQADAILITARRTPESPPSDQVMAVMTRDQYRLEQTQVWNTLGMRGTCSNNFTFEGAAPVEQVIPASFADIAAQSMLAYAHILWAATWYGIAANAVHRAEGFVQAEARRRPGTVPPGAMRLAELLNRLQQFRALILASIERYEQAKTDPDELSSISFVVALNGTKISASEAACDIIQRAFLVCGIHGYRNDSPFSLGRHLRDAMSSQIMINNDRILGNVSNLLSVYKHNPSLVA